MRLLLVEDDPELASMTRADLARAGFAVDLADNGIDGEHLGSHEPYDAIVLDLGLPGRSGLEVLKSWRQNNNRVPVIVLTARDQWFERVDGFKAGADDYLNKPFDSEVLLVKLKAILQRKASNTLADSKQFEFKIGNFHLNSKLRFLKYNEEEAIKLSPKENELLRLLALHENDLMPRELALTKIWRDDNYFTSRSMDVYIAKLRKYLKRDDVVEILNIHGEGFRLVVKVE